MNIRTTVSGIGTSAQERAAVLIALAIAKRETTLDAERARGPNATGTMVPAAATRPPQGGK